MVDFRPPSAGEIENEKAKEKAGKYYQLTIDHVKEVLADPKAVYPDYDAKEGYQLAGFVWFQGFNDMVGSYPRLEAEKGKKSIKDYSEYSRLLSCFIRDVRKDLSAPKLPFVTGVMGVGGATEGDGAAAFRKSMAALDLTDQFKGDVANVFTHEYWPSEIDDIMAKINPIKSQYRGKQNELQKQGLEGDAFKEASMKLNEEKAEKIKTVLNEEEIFLMENGISHQGFHYYGSAKFFGQIGKAFAEALVALHKGK